MSLKRIWAMFVARSREFYRDRAAFGWNVVFPFLLIGGFAILFGSNEPDQFKVGLFPCSASEDPVTMPCMPSELEDIRYLGIVPLADLSQGMEKLRHHKIDILIQTDETPYAYWINDTSPKGYVVERMLAGSIPPAGDPLLIRRKVIASRQIRYIDWFFPGVVGMSMMFSALYGVGYVIVRYRKNGVLKRLEATPLNAFEYLSAQLLSRFFMITFSVLVLWVGCKLVFDFTVEGTYLDLVIMLMAGCFSLISLGLVLASRGTSEEFTEGILNLITWPMMFLSGVWFSIEGAPAWVQTVAQIFPLTHLLNGVRKIMNDGVALAGVQHELFILAGMTALFLVLGAALFKWNK